MAKITTFRDLLTYRGARGEARRIFKVTMTFPGEERNSLVDQIRGSSRAVAAMIGEAWARGRYEGVFVNKISEGLGEATETQVWLDHALDAGYLASSEHADLNATWSEMGAMLQGMMDKAHSFCGT